MAGVATDAHNIEVWHKIILKINISHQNDNKTNLIFFYSKLYKIIIKFFNELVLNIKLW
jgi:hypothetical protein